MEDNESQLKEINGHEKYEKDLKKSEDKYRTLLDSIDEGFCVVDVIFDKNNNPIDYRFLEINAAFEKQTGLHDAEGKLMRDLRSNHEEHWFEIYGKIALTGNPIRFEKPAKELNRFYDVYAFKIGGKESRKVAILFNDITERKRVEEELKRSEETARQRAEELEKLMDMVPAAIFLSEDPYCKSIVGNEEGNRMYEVGRGTDVSAGTTKGETFNVERRFFKEGKELKPEELPMQMAAKNGEEVLKFEMDALLPSGKIITMFGNACPLFDNNGNVRGCFGAYIDVTNLKQTEKALKDVRDNLEEQVKERTKELYNERQRLFDILESLPVMIILLSPDYHVKFANRAFREKFGESHGRRCYEYCYGSTEPCKFCESLKPLKTGQPHHWQFTGLDGSVIDAYDFPFTDIDGSQLVLEMDIDITEQKHNEEELNMAIEELKRSNEELQQFAYVSSHDLQEPLRTIASFSQLLERRYKGRLDSDADEFIDFIVEAAVRMKAQIEGLLEYSRVGTKGREFQAVNMDEILTKTIYNLNASIKESNAEITVDELPNVTGDGEQLQRVFQNLLSNAIRFRKCEEPLKIHISANKDIYDKEYVFSVQDNGIGIEEQYSERIFTIFRRLHTRDVYKGTGIGLSIVKRIIERHGGRIWVESEFGVGSTFYFTIPVELDKMGGGEIFK